MPPWLGFVLEAVWFHSRLSMIEYIEILCTYDRIANGPKVNKALLSKGYSKEAITKMSQIASDYTLKTLNVTIKNPDRFKHPSFDFICTLHENYKRGVLPFDGPLVDQPNKVMEILAVMNLLDIEMQEKNTKKAKEMNRNVRRRN